MENHLIRVKEIYIGLAKRLKEEQTDHQLTRKKLLRDIETAQADTITAKEIAEKELKSAKRRITELAAVQEWGKQHQSMATANAQLLALQKDEITKLKNELTEAKQPEPPATETATPKKTKEATSANSPEQSTEVPKKKKPKEVAAERKKNRLLPMRLKVNLTPMSDRPATPTKKNLNLNQSQYQVNFGYDIIYKNIIKRRCEYVRHCI